MDYQPIGHFAQPNGPASAQFQTGYLAIWNAMTPEQQNWVGVESSMVRIRALDDGLRLAAVLAVCGLVFGAIVAWFVTWRHFTNGKGKLAVPSLPQQNP